MRKFFKWLGIAVVLLIVLSVIGSIVGGNDQPTVQKVEENKPVKNEPEKKQDPVKKEKKDIITKENYNKIVSGDVLTGEGGMTKDQVLQMLGKPDNTVESNTQGVDGKSI
jgi:outer membrane protein assembly factor BamE (lipoprotein component of BamABCDE complex)